MFHPTLAVSLPCFKALEYVEHATSPKNLRVNRKIISRFQLTRDLLMRENFKFVFLLIMAFFIILYLP